MATRSRTTFQKRQKEMARAEKQREKVARRLQRKLEGKRPDSDSTDADAALNPESPDLPDLPGEPPEPLVASAAPQVIAPPGSDRS